MRLPWSPVAGLAHQTCAPLRSSITLEFDYGYTAVYSQFYYANLMLSDIAAVAGIAPVTNQGDCMCRTCFISSTVACTFTRSGATIQGEDCGRGTVEDEPEVLRSVYGCR